MVNRATSPTKSTSTNQPGPSLPLPPARRSWNYIWIKSTRCNGGNTS
jgi:hypothetical protein